MTKARDLIKASYRKIGVLGAGSSLQNEEAQDALSGLNAMVASWSTVGALIFTETKETFPLTGALSYTIGAGQDFDTTVPKMITSAYSTYSGYDRPIEIIDGEKYGQIADKDYAGLPDKLYFDSNYPTATIYLYPVNYASTTLTMFAQKPLLRFDSLDTVFAMPPEYERAIIYNLAIEMAPEFEAQPSPDVRRIAKSSLDMIKAQNKKNNKNTIKVDGMFLSRCGSFDIRTGYSR